MIYGLMVACATAAMVVGALLGFAFKVRNIWVLTLAILLTSVAVAIGISGYTLEGAYSPRESGLIGLAIGIVLALGFAVPHVMRLFSRRQKPEQREDRPELQRTYDKGA